jgi:hypothetical protein
MTVRRKGLLHYRCRNLLESIACQDDRIGTYGLQLDRDFQQFGHSPHAFAYPVGLGGQVRSVLRRDQSPLSHLVVRIRSSLLVENES